MIQSDHPAGKRMRRRRGGANRLINCRRDPPAKVLAARISMSHLVPLLEFNHSSSTSLDWSVAERSAAGFPYVASNNPCRRGRRNAFGQKVSERHPTRRLYLSRVKGNIPPYVKTRIPDRRRLVQPSRQ